VAISHCVANRAESEDFDTAKLDQVRTASQPEPLSCPKEE
jgi:hypothetical protein